MATTTYKKDIKNTDEKDIVELLKEINKLNPGWFVEENIIGYKGFFRKKPIKAYTIYYRLSSKDKQVHLTKEFGVEFQIINIYHGDTMFNFNYEYESVLNFLLGLRIGLDVQCQK